MAYVKELRDATRHDESMAKGARRDVHQRPVGTHALPDYGPVIMSKRPLRFRMWGVVGRGGEKPSLTRLAEASALQRDIISEQILYAAVMSENEILIQYGLWGHQRSVIQ